MADTNSLADRFAEQRGRLQRLAYGMLGSLRQADDAVQESWLRLARAERAAIADLASWLTEVVARICLDLLRKQRSRRATTPGAVRLPDPLVQPERVGAGEPAPARPEVIRLALFVALDTLAPTERLAFVLHELCALSHVQAAPILSRTPEAVRRLTSRARGRVLAASRSLGQPEPAHDAQRRTVDMFLAATRRGDFDALLALLDPDVVLRADRGVLPSTRGCELRGAGQVAKQAVVFSRLVERARPVLVNGAPGALSWLPGGQPFSVLGFTMTDRQIVELYVFADAVRLAELDLQVLTES